MSTKKAAPLRRTTTTTATVEIVEEPWDGTPIEVTTAEAIEAVAATREHTSPAVVVGLSIAATVIIYLFAFGVLASH